MSQEAKKVDRRNFLNYTIAVVVTGLLVGLGTYYLTPKGGEKTITVEKTVTSTVTVSPTITVTSPTTTAPQKTLRVLGFSGSLGDPHIPVFDEFSKQKNVKIEYIRIGYDELAEKAVSLLQAGSSEFDIIFQDDPFFPRLASKGWIAPLDTLGLKKDSDVFESLWDLGSWPTPPYMGAVPPGERNKEPHIYALPHCGGPGEFYGVRKDLLDQKGLSVPKNWDEALEVAKAFYDPNKPFYGWVCRGTKGDPIAFDSMTFLYDYGMPYMFNDNWEPQFNSPEAVEGFQMFLNFAKYAPPGLPTYGATEYALEFINGRVASGMINPGDVVADIEKPGSASAGKLLWMFPPAGPKARKGVLGVFTVVVNNFSKNKDLAIDLLNYLISEEGQMIFATKGKGWPIRRSLWKKSEINQDPVFKPLYPALPDFLDSKPIPYPRTTEWLTMVDIYGGYLNAALIGQLSAKEALDKAASEITDYLKRIGYIK
jgi:multiple sugar transport system substrate-binding protein